MIDVGGKRDTERRAVASGEFRAKPETLQRIWARTLPKGDALALAEVSGILGAKNASAMLPLCHPLALTSVRVWFDCPSGDKVGPAVDLRAHCEVKTIGKTGVEMEALAGVNAALLCVYDLAKNIDPELEITSIRLELKEGGKSDVRHQAALRGVTARVLVLSDRCAAGQAEDRSGPAAADWLRAHGASQVLGPQVVQDEPEQLRAHFDAWLTGAPGAGTGEFWVTSGGTGVSPRDRTPETVSEWVSRRGGRAIPGIGELLRREGAALGVQAAWLSRSCAFEVERRLVVCLPGSPKAVVEGLDALRPLLAHLMSVVRGDPSGSQYP